MSTGENANVIKVPRRKNNTAVTPKEPKSLTNHHSFSVSQKEKWVI
jgi:hypothetical protein